MTVMALLGVGLYVKGSREAAALYQEAFGAELGYHVLNGDGTFFHSELSVKGEPFCSVVEAKEPAGGYNPVELGCTFDTREALERAFALLAEGGKVNLPLCELPWSPWAAEVTDRFGVRWFLTLAQHRPPEDFKP
ncbi:MAG: VOC family protein [Aristaeellaceae bacterium]